MGARRLGRLCDRRLSHRNITTNRNDVNNGTGQPQATRVNGRRRRAHAPRKQRRRAPIALLIAPPSPHSRRESTSAASIATTAAGEATAGPAHPAPAEPVDQQRPHARNARGSKRGSSRGRGRSSSAGPRAYSSPKEAVCCTHGSPIGRTRKAGSEQGIANESCRGPGRGEAEIGHLPTRAARSHADSIIKLDNVGAGRVEGGGASSKPAAGLYSGQCGGLGRRAPPQGARASRAA